MGSRVLRSLRRSAWATALLACAGMLPAAPAPTLLAPPAAAKGKETGPPAFERDFLSKYASEDAAKRSEGIDGLINATDPDKFRILTTHVVGKEKRADVVSRAVEILAKIRDPATCEALAKAARTGDRDKRVVLIESMATMAHSGAAHKALLEMLEDKDAYVRAMSAYAVGEHRVMDAADPLLGCLDDRHWQVQSAALSALTRLPDKEALKPRLPKIVDFMELSSGRLRDDASDALKRLTGKNFGRDPDAWRAWLAGGDAAAPAKPAEGSGGGTPKSGYADQGEKPHFYGMDVVSHRVVIVMDISLSMNDPIEIDRDRLRRETSRRRVVTGNDAPKSEPDAPEEDKGYDIPWWRIKTRLDLARYQTINLLSKLQPEQNFELILFSTKVTPWMGRLVPANQANRQKAIAMVEQIKPEAQTNTWDAIEKAFELSDASVRSGALGPDEMYLVTDGAPSVGGITDPQQILDATLQLWRVHQMRINVIQVGIDLSFLRKMAQATGGQSKSFK